MKYLLLLFLVEMAFSQEVINRELKTEDYDLWESFTSSSMSADGQWVSYGLKQNDRDTLFLCSTASKKRFPFPNSTWATFSHNSRWFAFYQENSLHLLDLRTQRSRSVSQDVLDYVFSNADAYMLVFVPEENNITLQVLDLKTMQTDFIRTIKSYVVSPDKKRIAVVVLENGIETLKVYTLSSTIKELVIAKAVEASFEDLKWDAFGEKLAFFKAAEKEIDGKSTLVLCWSTGFDNEVVLKTLAISTNPVFSKNSLLSKHNLHVEANSTTVFFTAQQPIDSVSEDSKPSNVQIWRTDDLTLPPKEKHSPLLSLQWYLWDTDDNRISAVEDDLHPYSVYMNGHDHALVYIPDGLASLYKTSDEMISMYIKNLKTGFKQNVSDDFIASKGSIFVSPTGKFIAYFKDKDWWVYDVYKNTNRCLTQGMSLSWHRLDYDKPGIVPPTFGPSWTKNDLELILYDRYDVWLMTPDGTFKKRLTNGAKTNNVYRFHHSLLPMSPNFYSYGFLSSAYDLSTAILLKTLNEVTLAEGFALLYADGKIHHLIERESTLNLVGSSTAMKRFLFVEQNFSLPPKLLYVTDEGVVETLYQSNLHQEEYHWGKSKLIYYSTSDNKHLKGALFYPSNYDSSKKYPLLVSIYEKKSKEVYDYIAPSLYTDSGFNVSTYVSNGYFVLYPDISYEVNFPGASALECVTAAILQVLEDYPVDEDKIGLVGHSFGGYETAYIMGQTDLFRTAVLGAPPIDLVSNYLTLDGHGKSNMWRYEMDQMRMTAPFYSEVFDQNSPLKFVENINSPLLIWTGNADLQVDWSNSLKLHAALWRLNKKSTLLVYPNEGHVFEGRSNQLDLTTKIRDWLDYYLKDGVEVEWMSSRE